MVEGLDKEEAVVPPLQVGIVLINGDMLQAAVAEEGRFRVAGGAGGKVQAGFVFAAELIFGGTGEDFAITSS